MTETSPAAVICEVHDYDSLVQGLRQRIHSLGTSFDVIDELLLVASRYSAKVLSPKPKKFMSPRFFGDILAAAASKVLFVEDVEQLDKIQHRLDLRSAWGTRLDRAVMITFSRRHYQTIGRKGIGASKF
jgi:hypothetical protein